MESGQFLVHESWRKVGKKPEQESDLVAYQG